MIVSPGERGAVCSWEHGGAWYLFVHFESPPSHSVVIGSMAGEGPSRSEAIGK